MGDVVYLAVHGLAQGFIYAAVALALVIIWRSTRVLNFAQGAMAVASTFIAFAVYEATGSIWLTMATALVAGGALGWIVERCIIRFVDPTEALSPVIVTLGLLTLIQGLAGMAFGNETRGFPTAFSRRAWSVGDTNIASPQDLFTMLAVAAALGLVFLLFTRTDLGLRLRASAFAPKTARLLGVRVSRMLTIGWVMAGVMGALAALLVVPAGIGLGPSAMDSALILGFTAAVIGGLDSVAGAVVGGLSLGVALSFASGWLGSASTPLVSLGLLLLVLLVRPGGLFTLAGARKV